MKRWLLCTLLVAGCSARTGEIALVNPSFETAGDTRQPVPGWRLAQHAGAPAYEMSIDAQTAAEGHASFRMHRLRSQVYGAITQQVALPAGSGGQKATLSARLKTQDVGAKGWILVMTVVTGHGNEQHRAEPRTGTHDFSEISVSELLPKDATAIEVSALLLDEGTGWLDDVHLRIGD